ncbi:hypothetical protein QYE76_038700 [Lolium multiflorum]|uniref:CCHC-type domain-containing protein n=1 Tax=Lolium multiflorum TaxID=4521 RepID=A0AAD8WR57_LOLMU|nr:hypothetical protein QYE76_038700 [Lolium multiflorum]
MGKGATPADLAPYIKRGGGVWPPPHHCLLLRPPLSSTIRCSGLGEALQLFFLHHHHHAAMLLDFGGYLSQPPLPAGTGRGRASSTPYARPSTEVLPDCSTGMIVYTNNEINLIMESPSISFNQFLEKEKLKSNGSNFTGSVILEADLQKRFEHHDPYELVNELKAIFETHAVVECYEASKHFFSCMMEEGSSVSEHMLAMSGHAKKLSDLGIVIPNKLGINRVLQSLPPSYKNFVMNYNMQNMNKELPELLSMLKSAEVEIKKENQVLMVNKTTSFKKQGKPNKGNFKKGGKKAVAPPVKPKAGPKPDIECYYCKEKGHWKRNCSKYLADLKSGLIKKKGIFDIHVIDVYLRFS